MTKAESVPTWKTAHCDKGEIQNNGRRYRFRNFPQGQSLGSDKLQLALWLASVCNIFRELCEICPNSVG
jgi:hypothetical protein